jgi:hypothetical protein
MQRFKFGSDVQRCGSDLQRFRGHYVLLKTDANRCSSDWNRCQIAAIGLQIAVHVTAHALRIDVNRCIPGPPGIMTTCTVESTVDCDRLRLSRHLALAASDADERPPRPSHTCLQLLPLHQHPQERSTVRMRMPVRMCQVLVPSRRHAYY